MSTPNRDFRQIITKKNYHKKYRKKYQSIHLYFYKLFTKLYLILSKRLKKKKITRIPLNKILDLDPLSKKLVLPDCNRAKATFEGLNIAFGAVSSFYVVPMNERSAAPLPRQATLVGVGTWKS